MDDIRISEIEVASATEDELRRLHDITVTLSAECWPDDTPRSFDTFLRQLRTTPPFQRTFRWLALRGNDPVGHARANYREGQDNQHILGGYVGVLPEERRRGLGTALLLRVVERAEREGKRLLIVDGDSFVPASNLFLEHHGGRHGITVGINALDLRRLDHELMRIWIESGQQKAGAAYDVLDWRDDIPEEHLEGFLALLHVMNTAPTEDLDVEDFVLTPEQFRQYEAARKERGQRLWVRVARRRDSGELAGYTMLFGDPDDPTLLHQGDTAVKPAHRGHRLGRWLKAANVLGALEDAPEAVWIRTGNAGSNQPMLAINHDMGFELYKTITSWQFDTEELAARLREDRSL